MKYDERQTFEHDLINRKISWLLNSQTILFAALAIVIGGNSKLEESEIEFFITVISILGILISLLIFLGVSMAILAKCLNFRNESAKQKKMRDEQKPVIKEGVLRIQGGEIKIKEGLLKIKEGELSIQEMDNTSEYESDPLQWGVRSPITIISLFPEFSMPLVFAGAWICIWSEFN